MRFTREQTAGLKFELWLASLLSELGSASGYYHVRHNLEVHRARWIYRQLDIVYEIRTYGLPEIGMIEAKYTSSRSLHYLLRAGPKHKSGQLYAPLDNVVIETQERRVFAGADKAFLVTNSPVDDLVHVQAQRYGLCIIEGMQLQTIWKNLGHHDTIDHAIAQTPITPTSSTKNIAQYPLSQRIVVPATTTRTYIQSRPING